MREMGEKLNYFRGEIVGCQQRSDWILSRIAADQLSVCGASEAWPGDISVMTSVICENRDTMTRSRAITCLPA